MLILSRKPGETVLIGDAITVTVLSVVGRQVRLGFNAPEAVNIIREELEGVPRKVKQPAPAEVPT